MNGFTLVDYSAFGLWILISLLLSYLIVRKLNFFGGEKKNSKSTSYWTCCRSSAVPNLEKNLVVYSKLNYVH